MTLVLCPVGVVRSVICAPWEKSEASILHPDMENGAGLCESQDSTNAHEYLLTNRDRKRRGTAKLPHFGRNEHCK